MCGVGERVVRRKGVLMEVGRGEGVRGVPYLVRRLWVWHACVCDEDRVTGGGGSLGGSGRCGGGGGWVCGVVGPVCRVIVV